MNGPTITMMHTMCTPEKLGKKELVEQVNYLQDAMLQHGQSLHEANCKLAETCRLANTLADHLYKLADAYDIGDQSSILLQVKHLSERRKSYKKPEVH